MSRSKQTPDEIRPFQMPSDKIYTITIIGAKSAMAISIRMINGGKWCCVSPTRTGEFNISYLSVDDAFMMMLTSKLTIAAAHKEAHIIYSQLIK